MSFFEKIFPGKPKGYEEQRAALSSADVKARMSLAKNSRTNREILYYLAEKDPDAKVRQAVIKNKAMPVHASPVLATDKDQDVRLALAGRLVELLPDLSQDKQSQLYAFAVQALGTLALDEVLKIRIALSSTLKDHAHAPPKVAGQLARDVEREVSEPVLRFCTALSDEDLIEILKSHPAEWVIEAVACRQMVSELVAGAVIETRNPPGGRALIENEGASLTEQLLHTIVDMARKLPEWQKPMAIRKTLPVSVARELAEFVDASVRDLLLKRGDFDENTTEEIAAVFRRRVDFASNSRDASEGEDVGARIRRLVKEGNLNENTLSDALAMRDRDFVIAAVAHMAKTDQHTAKKIFDMQSAKPIVALSWKASLSMRMALQLQKEIGRVDPKALLYPKGGTDYPMTQKDIDWQLEFLGLKN
jgi:uncharacterized protein (DUF2336 family)